MSRYGCRVARRHLRTPRGISAARRPYNCAEDGRPSRQPSRLRYRSCNIKNPSSCNTEAGSPQARSARHIPYILLMKSRSSYVLLPVASVSSSSWIPSPFSLFPSPSPSPARARGRSAAKLARCPLHWILATAPRAEVKEGAKALQLRASRPFSARWRRTRRTRTTRHSTPC